MKKPYSFDLTVSTTARLTVPAADYEKSVAEIKKFLVELQADPDGKLWAKALEQREEGLYKLMENTLEMFEGDVDAAAEAVLHSIIRRATAVSVKEAFNEDGVSHAQSVVTLVARGVSNTKEQAE